ncbi:helix-turn-helix transcriptional regulator [Streptomyces sp. NPDC099050]|uniref:helix-turn-helix transcriptional regulator n=1 Tax=Streptomyces sp. NPDC099050 TaxID=3366100 RepID=UPI0037F2EAEC
MIHLTRHAISTIRENYHEPIYLDDLARSAMMSKFYFLRVFQRTTGVTPGRFLSAVRLHEAKRLLVNTDFNVADISAQVCYSSASTFSRRFTASVGLSPTQFRKIGQGDPAEHPPVIPLPVPPGPLGSIAGTALVTGTPLPPLHIGVFDSPILQGRPQAWSRLDRAGTFTLPAVPPGTWYLHAVGPGVRTASGPHGDPPLLVGTSGPVRVDADACTRIDMAVRQEDWTRPPVLLAVPGIGPHPSRSPSPSPSPSEPKSGPADRWGARPLHRIPYERSAPGGRLAAV